MDLKLKIGWGFKLNELWASIENLSVTGEALDYGLEAFMNVKLLLRIENK